MPRLSIKLSEFIYYITFNSAKKVNLKLIYRKSTIWAFGNFDF